MNLYGQDKIYSIPTRTYPTTERSLELKRIFTLAEQSEYEIKCGIRLAIAAKQVRRQEIRLIEDELDNQSGSSEEEILTVSKEETNTFFQTRNFDNVFGITLGFLLGFCANILLQ